MGEPKKHRSASQVNTFATCGELYRLKYVDKPDQPPYPAAWLAQGTAYHEAVRFWEESGRSSLVILEETFNRYYDKEIESMKAQQPDLKLWLRAFSKKPEQDIAERKERGFRQFADYVEHAKREPFVIKDIDDYTLGIEVPFQVELGKITVRGQIDQIRQERIGIHVVDLKTGNRESAKFQLGVYKVAVEKIFGWPVVKASFFYAKDSKLVTLSEKDLERYSEEYVTSVFEALDRAVESKAFIPNPGSQCTFCELKKFCREMGN